MGVGERSRRVVLGSSWAEANGMAKSAAEKRDKRKKREELRIELKHERATKVPSNEMVATANIDGWLVRATTTRNCPLCLNRGFLGG